MNNFFPSVRVLVLLLRWWKVPVIIPLKFKTPSNVNKAPSSSIGSLLLLLLFRCVFLLSVLLREWGPTGIKKLLLTQIMIHNQFSYNVFGNVFLKTENKYIFGIFRNYCFIFIERLTLYYSCNYIFSFHRKKGS